MAKFLIKRDSDTPTGIYQRLAPMDSPLHGALHANNIITLSNSNQVTEVYAFAKSFEQAVRDGSPLVTSIDRTTMRASVPLKYNELFQTQFKQHFK